MRPRASHSGCNDDANANANSTSEFSRLHPKRGAQIVDLNLGLLDKLLIITARWRVEQTRQPRVVIAVPGTHGVGLAGLAQLFQRVLAHRLQQPVTRSASAVLGDHQRLVDAGRRGRRADGL
jgi:pantothenate kinase-related protein Tda10